MSSPALEVFAIFDSATGLPLSGLAAGASFLSYVNDLGVAVAQPIISEIGTTGLYFFSPVFADPARAIAYIIDFGATASPRRSWRYMRPEDWATDSISADVAVLKQIAIGKWEIKTTGADANTLILYQADGVTVLQKFLLADSVGTPTSINPYKRSPI